MGDKAYLIIGLTNKYEEEIVLASNKSSAIRKWWEEYYRWNSSGNLPNIKARGLTPFERWLFKDELKEVRLSNEPIQIFLRMWRSLMESQECWVSI